MTEPDTFNELQGLTDRLERAAEQLRSGELSADGAASLVEECARLAGQVTAEIDRLVRIAAAEPEAPPPGQAELL